MLSYLQESSMSFFVTLQSNFQHVMLYESSDLQEEARRVIPQQQLLSSAEQNLNKAKEADPGEADIVELWISSEYLLRVWDKWLFHTDTSPVTVVLNFLLIFVECKLGIEDFLVLELLRWFKQAFFSWVNCLPCSHCGGSTQNQGSLSPTTDDLRWGAQRVENHFCQSCQLSTRFPRFVFVLTSPWWTSVYFLDTRNFIVICCFKEKQTIRRLDSH